MSHTPGPWRVSNNGVGISVSAGGIRICQSGYVGAASMQTQQADIERRKANARLIAAAPDLLEALEKCSESLRDNLSMCQYKNERSMLSAFQAAELAIKKAKGGAE